MLRMMLRRMTLLLITGRNGGCRRRRRRATSGSSDGISSGIVPFTTFSSSHSGMQGRQLPHQGFVLLDLVSMNCLSVLSEIVESRELFSTVTSEWTFGSVFAKKTRPG